MQPGICKYCGRHIMHDMAPHISMYHLDLGQLWKWFPPWTDTRTAWNAELKQNVSGISTDVVLFSEHGAHLVHHYQVYGNCASHGSLRGTFMAKLTDFTNRACAEARSVAKRGRDSITGPGSSSSRPTLSPLIPMHRTTTLRPGKLFRLCPLLRCRMSLPFPLCRRLRCSTGLLAERRLTLVQTGQPRGMSRRQPKPQPGFPWLSTVLHR